jgi:chorismate mutase
MDVKNGADDLLIVRAQALPEVFGKVALAKDYLQTGQADSATEAARMAGISRSAFYKYKDVVHRYNQSAPHRVITLHSVLRDRPGVLSDMLGVFARVGANVLTVFQDIPHGGVASVSVTADVECMTVPAEQLIAQLGQLSGVMRIADISHKAAKTGG